MLGVVGEQPMPLAVVEHVRFDQRSAVGLNRIRRCERGVFETAPRIRLGVACLSETTSLDRLRHGSAAIAGPKHGD